MPGVTSIYSKFKLAERMKVCCQGTFPVVFHVRQKSHDWLQEVAAKSSKQLDGAELLANILEDGIKNHSATSLLLRKYAEIIDASKCCLLHEILSAMNENWLQSDGLSTLPCRKLQRFSLVLAGLIEASVM